MLPIDWNAMPVQLTLLLTLVVHAVTTVHAAALAWTRHRHQRRADANERPPPPPPPKTVDEVEAELAVATEKEKDDNVSTSSSSTTTSSSSSSSSCAQAKSAANTKEEEDISIDTSTNTDDKDGANNSDLNQNDNSGNNNDSADKPFLPEETLVIFDWDDTLFPTTALHKLSLFDMLQASDDQTVSNIVDSIYLMGRCITSVIRTAQNVGTVAVVTNASRSWMDETGETFVRDAYNTLRADDEVDIVSARDTYCEDDDYDYEYSKWKRKAIEQVVRNRFKMDGEGEEDEGEGEGKEEKEEGEEGEVKEEDEQKEQDNQIEDKEKDNNSNDDKDDDDDNDSNNNSDNVSENNSDSGGPFQTWRRRGDKTSHVRNIITIGDSEQEHIAVQAVARDLPQCCMKQIWVKRLKTPREHTLQLLEIMDQLNNMALKPGDLIVKI